MNPPCTSGLFPDKKMANPPTVLPMNHQEIVGNHTTAPKKAKGSGAVVKALAYESKVCQLHCHCQKMVKGTKLVVKTDKMN